MDEMTEISVEIDSAIVSHAAEVFERLGLDHAAAIDIFLREVICVRGLPFRPVAPKTHGEQIWEIIWKKDITIHLLDVSENGNILVDKDRHPELYDWVING